MSWEPTQRASRELLTRILRRVTRRLTTPGKLRTEAGRRKPTGPWSGACWRPGTDPEFHQPEGASGRVSSGGPRRDRRSMEARRWWSQPHHIPTAAPCQRHAVVRRRQLTQSPSKWRSARGRRHGRRQPGLPSHSLRGRQATSRSIPRVPRGRVAGREDHLQQAYGRVGKRA